MPAVLKSSPILRQTAILNPLVGAVEEVTAEEVRSAFAMNVEGTLNPALRLQLGADCMSSVETKLAQVKQELEKWRELVESTAFTE
jgi:hypothetical protein